MIEAGPARTFVAIVTLERFAALKRMIGYSRASAVLDQLCVDARVHLPDGEAARCGRSAIEITFIADSSIAAMRRMRELRDALSRRVEIDGYQLELAPVIGLADSGGAPVTDELVDAAEAALSEALESDLPLVEARPIAPRDGVDRFLLLRDLQRAISEGGLELHYQPKLRARTGLVDGAEALLRWTHPEHGPLPAEMVVRLAEETGNIRALTRWTIERALADQAWMRGHGCDVPLYINLSGALIHDSRFAQWLLGKLTEVKGAIGFEITETAMIADPDGALAHLEAFAAAGARLSIDDYGSGYSSLAYLQRMPVRELKIDRAFVAALNSSQRDPLLVRSTIDLAHALELEVVAEGVDTPEALALLQVMGCDLVQGYLLSRPIPRDELLAYVQQNRNGAPAFSQTAMQSQLRRRLRPS